jgi:hypothetical protein
LKTRRSIYFIQAKHQPFFKVGIANNVDRRLRELQVGCPLDLLLVQSWEAEYERIWQLESGLHTALRRYSTRGEWFKIHPNIMMPVLGRVAVLVDSATKTTIPEVGQEERVAIQELQRFQIDGFAVFKHIKPVNYLQQYE